ncbi:MAG: glycogen/starch synthase [Oscillospiraceae bacterium]|nr:glycogen/starch synthase [Oscillospiraceae bacterium]
MRKIKVLFVSSEAVPFAKTGGLADVIGSLPPALEKTRCEARVIIPLYRPIKQKFAKQLQFIGWKMVKMGWRSLYAGLYSIEKDGIIHYFIDNEYYFNFDTPYVEYVFDIERFCFFQRAVLEFIGDFMQYEPDVLHLNDWQCGMIPLLLDVHYRPIGKFIGVKTVYTVHNLKYQGIHGVEQIKDMLDLPDHVLTEELSLKDGAANFMKAGIVYSNSVTTVSPTYAYEIMTDYYGEGLNHTLQRYAYKVSGILNGINEVEFDPETDRLLPQTYTVKTYEKGKAVCKEAIQKQLKLDVNPGAPLCVMITRLVDQKGLDLFLRVVGEMLYDGIQIVVLGSGNSFYERTLAELAKQNSGKMESCIYYDNDLAHLLYAGADIFLMPSLFEPCGLSQMISMRYGTVPIVRETGGLKDTVKPYNEYTGEGNGFSFANINAHEFLFVTKYACDLYRHHKNVWNGLVRAGMSGDYSWTRSAKEYMGLYSLITGIDLSEKKKDLDAIPSPSPAKAQASASKAVAPAETAKASGAAPADAAMSAGNATKTRKPGKSSTNTPKPKSKKGGGEKS